MNTVFSYLNPLNVVSLVKPKGNADMLHEVISFDFLSSDYVPIYEINKVDNDEYDYGDMNLNEIEDYYLANYHKLKEIQQQESKFFEYVIKPNDTLFGLELKFNISQQKILAINQLSENFLMPGMVIRLPETNYVADQDAEEQPQEEFKNVKNLMDEIMTKTHTKKFDVYYVTSIGNIQGGLTINEDILLFDPLSNDDNKQLAENLNYTYLQFQACICITKITQVQMKELPMRMVEVGKGAKKDYLVQITLQHFKRNQKLIEPATNISLYFRIVEDDQLFENTSQIVNHICEMMSIQNSTNGPDLTQIPFYDIITDEDIQMQLIKRANKIWGGSEFIPQLIGESTIMNQDHFIELISYVPTVFKAAHWKLGYSKLKDGSSFNTLLHKTFNSAPNIVMVRDFKDRVFGAYMNDYPQLVPQKFYGNGETFLWRLKVREEGELEVFEWTQKNQDFILCDSDGLAVGCGEKYGLYIDKNLSRGYSAKCETFENEVLNDEDGFEIAELEIWLLDLD